MKCCKSKYGGSKDEKLKVAREMLDGWIESERAVMTGQSYTIGTRQLTRADLEEIGERIKYWKNEISKLESTSSGRWIKSGFMATTRF